MSTAKLPDNIYQNLDSVAVKVIETSLGRKLTGLMRQELGLRSEDVRAFSADDTPIEKLAELAGESKRYFHTLRKEADIKGHPQLSAFLLDLDTLPRIGGFSGLSLHTFFLGGPPNRFHGVIQLAYRFDCLIRYITKTKDEPLSSAFLEACLKALSLPAANYMEPVTTTGGSLLGELLDLGESLSQDERSNLFQLADNLYLSWLARLDIEFSMDQLRSPKPTPWFDYLAPKLDCNKVTKGLKGKPWPNGWYTHPNARLISFSYCLARKLVTGRWPDAPPTVKELARAPGFAGDWRTSKQNPDQSAQQEIDPYKIIDHWRQGRNLDQGDFWDFWEAFCNAPTTAAPSPILIASRFWALVLPKARVQKSPALVSQARARYLQWWKHHLKEDQDGGRVFHGHIPRPGCFDLL